MLQRISVCVLFYKVKLPAEEWCHKKLTNPITTSTSKNIHAFVFLCIAKYANSTYSKACIGLRLFHHIFSPNTSTPVLRTPVMKIYINPIAGRSAKYPRYGRYFTSVVFAIYTSKLRVPMQPIRNNNIRL